MRTLKQTRWASAVLPPSLLSVVAAAALAACSGSAASGAEGQRLKNKGSDSFASLAQAWSEGFRELSPSIDVTVSGGGPGIAFSGLIQGEVDLVNSSRLMKASELKKAQAAGVKPALFTVGREVLAVYVHKNNPIESITFEQLAAIFGDGGAVERWSQLGVEMGSEVSDAIVRVSRQSGSGANGYFRKTVLGPTGRFKLGSLDSNGAKAVVDTIERTPGAIGYSGLAFATDQLKLVPVAAAGAAPVAPSLASAMDGSYPIVRPLFMYTAGQPTGAVRRYMDWILSRAGQEILSRRGYVPLLAGSSFEGR